jgi:FixJ family two-component response regulator
MTIDGEPKDSADALIAIVDDDASVRSSTQRLVRCLGGRAQAFASAEEFLASGCADQSVCVILDVRMPGMDGLELQRRLGETHPGLPVAFFSAYASEEEERRALAAGAIGFLRKPVSKQALVRALAPAVKLEGDQCDDSHT